MASNFPKHHGIVLAANSWIENASFERLAVDPVPVAAGRVWFNTTDRVFKYSTLDGVGAVVINSVASVEALTATMSDLSAVDTRLTTVETNMFKHDGSVAMTGNLNANSFKVVNVADGASASDAVNFGQLDTVRSNLQTELDTTQTGAGLSATGTYVPNASANFISTASSLMDADNKLDASLKLEETNRVAAVTSLDTRVTTVESQVNGKIGNITTLTTTAKDTIVASINELDADLAAEVARATAAETLLQTNLTTEATARTTEDTAINTRIDDLEMIVATGSSIRGSFQTVTDLATLDETTLRDGYMYGIKDTNDVYVYAAGLTSYDYKPAGWTGGFVQFVNIADLTGAVATEAATRLAADTLLQTNLDAEATRATAAEATLSTNLASEVTRATTAETAIKTAINAGKHTFTAGAAALVHTVTHNLNTDMFVFTVMTEDAQGVYRNDIVPVEIVDANTIKVELSEARKVKVSIISMAVIS